MRTGALARLLASAVAIGGGVAYLRFRREMAHRITILARNGTIAETSAGLIEYAEEGSGRPALVIHGAGGGYDQGLMIGEPLSGTCRVIAPSRFGYLRTPVPEDHSPAAQADAHAALLDHLGIERAIVMGASAGAPSAIELALRHPDRVAALILLMPRSYDPGDSMSVDARPESQFVLRLIEGSADFLFWTARHVARRWIVRFMGTPPEVEANAPAAEREQVSRVIDSLLPLSRRAKGVAIDSNTVLAPWPLERIAAPTLVISAEDDLFNSLPGARYTADRIKGAWLEVLGSGGHLIVGQRQRVSEVVAEFLRELPED